jgi:DNA repair photolyase
MPFVLKPIEARQALTQNGKGKMAINPYQGCVFACEFCSAIKMQYFTGRTAEKWDKRGWGTWIDFKTNLIELLKTEKSKVQRSKIHFGNATDIYMPLEKRLKLVPPILEFLIENPPLELEIQTRGTSRDIARDIPLLQELARKTSVLVSYSIHTDREDVKRIFEPKAPSLKDREKGLKMYFDAGIRTRLSCMPFLPMNPGMFAERLAPYITNHVWAAPMYHEHLTKELFKKHFPEWLSPQFQAQKLEELQEAFEKRGVPCYIRTHSTNRPEQRLEIRQARLAERDNVRAELPGAQLPLW